MLQASNEAEDGIAVPAVIDHEDMFEFAPVSLWLEDYSALRTLFAVWRAEGVDDLAAYLRADAGRVQRCAESLRVVRVNAKTLQLFEADDLSHLIANLDAVFRDDMRDHHIAELVALWEGRTAFSSKTVNYSLGGSRLDIQLSAQVLPGHEANWTRVLVAIEDVTEREDAVRRLGTSENYARGLFEHSPVSLWVEDFRGVRRLLEEVRERGIEDFRVFTDVHPEFVEQCMAEIVVLDVNRHTLDLFAAPDKQALLRRLGEVFRDGMHQPFREQLCDLWTGKLFQTREVVNYALDGQELHLHLQFSVLPGHEADWSLVQIALTDITARKKAEAYLAFLGKHDPLTKLHNRAFYQDEINRLERKKAAVTVIVADLNGLKGVNDEFGHAAGDHLLSRAGEVLAKAVDAPARVARIGGDEFAILLPDADDHDGARTMATLDDLVTLNNQYHARLPLSFAVGRATRQPGERLEETARRADAAMYADKRMFYARETKRDRRAG